MSHISADDPLVIAIDSSTTSTKAIVVDTQGNVISLGRREIALLSPEQGFGEHAPRQWWTSTHEAVGEAVGKLTPAEKERIAAFGITHQRESFAPFTADGTPLRNGILWLDIRAADQILRYGTPEIHQLSGKPADVTPAIYKMAWVKEHQPDLWASAEKVTTVSAYIAFCLTGSWVDSTACADSLGLFDIAKLDYDEGLLQIAGVRRDQMAELVKPGQVLGTLKRAVADEWGVRGLQEHYVETFDQRRRCALSLTYYSHGDTRSRGIAILAFKEVMRRRGFEAARDELPDHLPVVLEFCALDESDIGGQMLAANREGLEVLRTALRSAGSPYSHLLEALVLTLPEPDERTLAGYRRLVSQGPPTELVGAGDLDATPFPVPER